VSGGTRSWKNKNKETESGDGGTVGGEDKGGGAGRSGSGRVRRSVPAVSTVNLDKHSHVTLLQV